jgi:hypothetical protein
MRVRTKKSGSKGRKREEKRREGKAGKEKGND